MTFTTLAVYRDGGAHSAAINMAIDEALLEIAQIPSIRFYRWDHPALSFGYFAKFAEVAPYLFPHDLVRRWTGGGIVFHGEDLTYSIVIPANDPTFCESSMSIYESVHRALCDVLNANGDRAVVAGGVDPGRMRIAASATGYNCFTHPVRADVMLNGRKIAGAAQRRAKHGLLQQGSIQYVDPDNGLAERFAQALSPDRRERRIDNCTLSRAQELARHKYGAESWLRKR
jgi:lipoate-protein ligase A